MITNPDWRKPTSKPLFHQFSLDCIDKLEYFQKKLSERKSDEKACLKELEQMLSREIKRADFLAFALKNYTELLSYIASGKVCIRIHRDEAGMIWFGVG
ncbi:MAG: hypothetical protein MRK01_00405 [Candidatus Scalindua sp.]|nr:hypothetical protein [Candidatus Scalindua sp.]